MKTTAKTKLILSSVMVVLVVAAIVVPLSGNSRRSHAQSPASGTPMPSQGQVGTSSSSPSNTSNVASSDPGASYTVPATVQWVNTHITLSNGDILKVSASGSWSADPADGFTDPNGYTKESADNFLNLTDIGACSVCATTQTPNWGALIGYIGFNPPAAGSYTDPTIRPEAQKVFVIGGSYYQTITTAGTLYLNFNDDAYSGFTVDNAGQVTATVTALRRLSTDPYMNSTSQHQTEVEPDSFSFGSTIVTAFQVGRFTDGGSDNIGWATSTDSGTTFTNGFLSGITTFAGGSFDRVSDPSVAYDAKDGVWMIASLAVTVQSSPSGNVGGTAVLVSRSTDGLHWNVPVVVSVAGRVTRYDKPWIVCDNTSSPHFGNCYIGWWKYFIVGCPVCTLPHPMLMSTSTDKGMTWGKPLETADHAEGLGVQPLVQPNGTVIVPYLHLANPTSTTEEQGEIRAFTSINGGDSWNATILIASIDFHLPGGLRADPLPTAAIDQSGKVYVVWSDCNFEEMAGFGCTANDFAMSTSIDGVTWSAVQRIDIPSDPVGSGIDHFIPGLAVGSFGHFALAYYYSTNGCNFGSCGGLAVGFISSSNGGTSWSTPLQITGPMMLNWLPNTKDPETGSVTGRMVGDYISTSLTFGSFFSSVAFPVFAVATAPSGAADCADAGAVCHEAIYTVVNGLI